MGPGKGPGPKIGPGAQGPRGHPQAPQGPPGPPKGPGRPGKRFWTFSEKVVFGTPDPPDPSPGGPLVSVGSGKPLCLAEF